MKYIKKEFLSKEDINKIKELELICKNFDNINFKFELDYKYNDATYKNFNNDEHRFLDYYAYDNELLVGYIGIFKMIGHTMEVNGMVHPKYRNQGIFKKLFEMVLKDAKKYKESKVILICDRKSNSGKAFIKTIGADYFRTEIDMSYDIGKTLLNVKPLIKLEKAKNTDSDEIQRQNQLSEDNSDESLDLLDSDEEILMPEDEEEKGNTIFLIKIADEIIGKINLSILDDTGWIYGFFIYKNYRSQGYGMQALHKAAEYFKESGINTMNLQVDIKNEKALRLYKYFGFKEMSGMDYFILEI